MTPPPATEKTVGFRLAQHNEIPETRVPLSQVTAWTDPDSFLMEEVNEQLPKDETVWLAFDSCGCNACGLKQYKALMKIFKDGYNDAEMPSNHFRRCMKKLSKKYGLRKLYDQIEVTTANFPTLGGDSDEDLDI